MWFLECDGELLDHKKLWLRPGTIHLLGRTRPDPNAKERCQYIEHKSVSRKHLTITVEDVSPGDSAHLHSKIKLVVTDGSKLGTTINGEKIVKAPKTLDKNENTIRLGSYDVQFSIKWLPKVFSFTSLSREAKKAADSLASVRPQLEPLGIKCVTEYVTQYTTHVVSKKRNTSAVLQALVNGRHVVTDPYIDAVAAAAQRPDDTTTSGTSPLEMDFDAHWPKELDYLPGPANEPNPRPEKDESFSPNEERAEIFTRYTFVFCEGSQYEILLPVITGGGGKALLRDVTSGNINVDDMISYIKEVAGKKGVGGFKLSQQPAKGGVVVVRASDKSQASGTRFYHDLDLALDQRSVEQNEFLDAILNVDATSLKRALEVDYEDEGGNGEESRPQIARRQSTPVPQTQAGTQWHSATPVTDRLQQETAQDPFVEGANSTAQSADASHVAPSALKRKRRVIAQSRFKGFDDFDPSQLVKHRAPSPSQYDQNADSMEVDSQSQLQSQSQSQAPATQRSHQSHSVSNRKRPAEPLEEEETAGDVLDGMLKGAATMKRRRIEEEIKGNHSFSKHANDADSDDMDGSSNTKVRPRKRKEKEMDVMKAVQERREEDERRQQAEEESLRDALDGMEVSEIRNLAKIEEMEVVPRPRLTRAVREGGDSDRWDPAWNGRRNFKRFKKVQPGPQGDADAQETRGPQRRRVIVELEPYKAKTYGMGDEYWLEPSGTSQDQKRNKDKGKKRSSQSQASASQPLEDARSQRSAVIANGADSNDDNYNEDHDNDSCAEQRFRRRIRASRLEDAENDRIGELLPEEIAGRARDTGLQAAAHEQSQASTQTLRGTAGTQQRKRAAAEPAAGATAAKKRQTRIATKAPAVTKREESSDEDDGLKFRRRRRV